MELKIEDVIERYQRELAAVTHRAILAEATVAALQAQSDDETHEG